MATPLEGPISKIRRTPSTAMLRHSATQSTGLTNTFCAMPRACSASKPQAAAHSATCATAGSMAGWWKPISTSSRHSRFSGVWPFSSFTVSDNTPHTRATDSGLPLTTKPSALFCKPIHGRSAESAGNSSSITAASCPRLTPCTITIGCKSSCRYMPVARPCSVAAAPINSAKASSSAACCGSRIR